MAHARRLLVVPFDLWERAVAMFKRVRRGYPSPEDFRRMGPEKTIAYLERIGSIREAEAALARHRALKATTTDREAGPN